MIFNARAIPAAEVQQWIANDNTVVKISVFLTAFIVYDAGKQTISIWLFMKLTSS